MQKDLKHNPVVWIKACLVEKLYVTCLMWTGFSVNEVLLFHSVQSFILLQGDLDVLRICLEIRVSSSCCFFRLLKLKEREKNSKG